MRGEEFVFFIPIVTIAGFWIFMIMRSQSRCRVRELEIRERIAMIEKGHVPPPEVDPKGFERALERRDRGTRSDGPPSRASFRQRRAGTALIGVGLGLMILITFAGESPETAVGIGGFLVMLGLAFLVNGLLEQRHAYRLSEGAPVSALESAPKTEEPR